MSILNIKNFSLYLFLTVSAFLAAVFFTATPSWAQDFEIVDSILVKYNGSGGNITIPSTVQKIYPNVFLDNPYITTVNIQEGVFEICDDAFHGCTQLQKVHLPKTLKTIGKSAFKDCRKMKELNLPPELTVIEMGAFSGCKTLEKIKIPKSVTVIAEGAFMNCTNVKSFSVESGNKFYTSENGILCTSDRKTLIAYPLASGGSTVSIPDGVVNIERGALAYHPTMSEIIFPGSLKEIQPYAFRNCLGLHEVVIPDTIETIYQYTFMNCSNLNRVFYMGNTKTQVHAYDGAYSVTIYANDDSRAKRYAALYNMNWLPLNDTDTIIYPIDKSISHS